MNDPIGRFGSCKPGTRAPNRSRDGDDRFLLTDDALRQRIFHLEKLVALAFEHLVDRHARPPRHDGRDLIRRHGLFDHGTLVASCVSTPASFFSRSGMRP